MNRIDQIAFLGAVVLIIGGFGAIGAAAGLRVAIGTSTHVLDCSMRACVPLVREFNSLSKTFLTGGVVAMICGSIVRVWISKHAGEPAGE